MCAGIGAVADFGMYIAADVVAFVEVGVVAFVEAGVVALQERQLQTYPQLFGRFLFFSSDFYPFLHCLWLGLVRFFFTSGLADGAMEAVVAAVSVLTVAAAAFGGSFLGQNLDMCPNCLQLQQRGRLPSTITIICLSLLTMVSEIA